MPPTVILAAALAAATPNQQQDARDLSRRSIVEYNAGEFGKALADITRAYELDPRPGLLYNLGQCHRALEHWKQARFFFQGYLREFPDAPNRKQVRKLVAEVEAQLEAQERREAAAREAFARPAPSPTPVPIVIAPPPPPPPAIVAGPEAVPRPSRAGKAAGWTLLSLGLAAGVGGGAWNGIAYAGRPTNQGPPGGSIEYSQTRPQVDAYNTAMVASPVVWGIGAALALSGIIVLLAAH